MDTPALLRLARRRAGLLQRECAARAGTTQSVISAYERGLRDPTTATLARLLLATGHRARVELEPVHDAMPPPADPAERADRLLDVLLLSDALPPRPVGPLHAPRLVSTGARP